MKTTRFGVAAFFLLVPLVGGTATRPAIAAEDEVVAGETGRALDEAVHRASSRAFWGAALVAKDGEILLAKGYGAADYAERANTANTLFEIASTSKQFTAAAVLRLQMDGKLKISDSIAKHLRSVPKDKKDITIHHLLTHTSGIPGDAGVPYASPISRSDYVEHVLDRPLASVPGETFAYNNATYALLAAIVETVSRTAFEKYSKEKLFEPAGLVDTGFVGDEALDEKRQTIRRSDRMPEATAIDWHWGWGYRGMGGVISTVHDMYLWDRALRGDAVLDEAAKTVYYAPNRERYACGWRIDRTDRGTRKVHHSGGVHGYACQYARYTEEDAVVVILSNGRTNIHAIDRAIEAILFPPPTITATLHIGAFEPDERQIKTLPATLAWAVEAAGGQVLVHLTETDAGERAATLSLPAGPAKKLAYDLESALRDQANDGDDAGVEAGFYLQPYALTPPRLEITDGLTLMLRARYEGRGEDGERVVDERITLSVVDSIRHQWPLMVKMGTSAARSLLKQLQAALD